MKNLIHLVNSKYEWLLLPTGFTAKFVFVFILTLENAFRFYFKLNRNSPRDFQSGPPFDRRVFVAINENFKRFQYFNFETDFLEIFKKLEHCFLVESTKIVNASFPYKTAISEVNVKTNRMVTTKWPYRKERNFASNHFIFLKILFQFKKLLEKVYMMYQQSKCPYFHFL